MSMKLDFDISAPDLDRLIRKMNDAQRRIIAPEITRVMNETGAAVQREIAKEAPIGADSDLMRSIEFQVERRAPWPTFVRIGPTVVHGIYVAVGTKRHWPPFGPASALQRWVRLKLRVPEDQVRSVTFLIARTIARKGTEANPYHIRGKEAAEGEVSRIWANMAARVAERFRRG